MQTKDLKEQSLKEIASVIRHWFKLEIGFKEAHKQIGDILDNAIQSAIKEREKELIEKIKDVLTSDGGGVDKLYEYLGYKSDGTTDNLSKKEKGGD